MAIAQAWYTAVLSRTQRLPELATLLSKSDAVGQAQTPQQMKQAIRAMISGSRKVRHG